MEEHDQDVELTRESLSGLPMETLARIESKLGRKRFAEIMFGASDGDETVDDEGALHSIDTARRPAADNSTISKTKHAPVEISSKRKPRQVRRVVERTRKMGRDPRFDKLDGNVEKEVFERRYQFVTDLQKEEAVRKLHFCVVCVCVCVYVYVCVCMYVCVCVCVYV